MTDKQNPAADSEESELERLRKENAQLRRKLAEARADTKPNAKAVPQEPSFGMSEGERTDLELTGKSVSPFTGKVTEKG